MLRPFLDRWRLCALVAAAAMLAIAHAFETFGGYSPCNLCLRQREVYWTIAAVSAVFMVVVRLPGGPKLRQASCWLLAALFLFSAGLAAFHAGVEWKFWSGPTSCSGGGGAISVDSLSALMAGAEIRPPSCDTAAWVFAGLSMAGWNALGALGLTALSALAALRERAKL